MVQENIILIEKIIFIYTIEGCGPLHIQREKCAYVQHLFWPLRCTYSSREHADHDKILHVGSGFLYVAFWFYLTNGNNLYIYIYVCSFLVDDVPIRRYPRKSDATFPERPMYAYGSIWDASSWATEDGKYKADYKYQPFFGRYRNFKLQGCATESSASCQPPSASPSSSGSLSPQQLAAMQWVQNNYLVYYYCHDPRRDHTLTPEC